jgi:hypothetical protein
MATRADVRRIALSLPATVEAEDRFAFSVGVRELLTDAWRTQAPKALVREFDATRS